MESNQQKRESNPGVTLKRVNNTSPTRKSPQRNRDRSDSDSTPHRRQRSTSRYTLCRVRPSHKMNIFQEEDMFEEVRLKFTTNFSEDNRKIKSLTEQSKRA